MKTSRVVSVMGGAVLATILGFSFGSYSQVVVSRQTTGLQLVPSESLPQFGTFYFLQRPNYPPIPFDPFPGLPVYSMGADVFLVDDGSVDYVQLQEARQAQLSTEGSSGVGMMAAAGPPAPPGGGGGGTNTILSGQRVYGSNDLWLQITARSNTTAYLTIHPSWNVTNGMYDLLYCTNLAPPISWRWLTYSDPGQTNLIVPNATDAQSFYRLSTATNSLGTDFWIAFFHMQLSRFYATFLSVSITSPRGASGTVTILGLGITTNFSVAAGAVTNISIDASAMMFEDDDFGYVESDGIHITSSQPVAVYALQYQYGASAAFTCYPTPLLGTNYCVLARPACAVGVFSELGIVATTNNTTVTIIPSPTANLLWGLTSNYNVTMGSGDAYQIRSSDNTHDVIGTWIRSDKPIAVFAGTEVADVPDTNTLYGNPLMQEQLPVDSWGTEALALSFAGRTNGDSYRVLAAYSNTVITITGKVVTVTNESLPPWKVTASNKTVVVTNQAGQFYDIIIDGPAQFQASQPIQVAQFSNGGYFDHFVDPNNPQAEGDPCEILLPPTGHYLKTNIVFTLTNDLPNHVIGDFDQNYMNLIVPQSATNSTWVDGSLVAAANFVAIGTSGYYGAQLSVTNSGAHKITSSQPVGVEVYGWGNWDAYGYFGGTVK